MFLKFRKKLAWGLTIGLCLVTLMGAYVEAADDIKIGVSAALTGASGELGQELLAGTMAYINKVNKNGGIGGRKLKLIVYDDAYEPIKAINNTVKLLNEDNVDLLFGYVGTPTLTRVLPLLKHHGHRDEHGITMFFPFTGAEPQRTAPYDELVYNLRGSYYQETEGLVSKFIKQGRKRIAVFYQLDGYGRNGWSGVRSALGRRDLKNGK